ncbi:hypothetical protein [Massilia sp. Root351]|uniref:hypothetical protein n=1 Tax=Massilia sp. Root351 TaxID=1736522 RepID=UPI0009E9B2B4|nr:hypothetical protein [Massilia sp. Root351]
MHFEVPKAGLKTAREFLGEYSMIVVSILTALALEHAAQSWHHSHRAHDAERKIEAELRINLDELQKVSAANKKQMEHIMQMRKGLLADIKAKSSEKELLEHFTQNAGKRYGLNLQTPTLRREAWDVAVASQAASWMSAELLQRYSALYAQQRDTLTAVTGDTQLTLSGPDMLNTLSDLELGTVDPHALYRSLRQMESTIDSVQGNLGMLEQQMRAALAKA